MSSRYQLLFPVSIAIAAIGIYVGTVFSYLTAPRGEATGYVPILLGLTLFALLVGTCTRLFAPATRLRWLVVCTAIVVAVIVFVLLFLFLILNLRGS